LALGRHEILYTPAPGRYKKDHRSCCYGVSDSVSFFVDGLAHAWRVADRLLDGVDAGVNTVHRGGQFARNAGFPVPGKPPKTIRMDPDFARGFRLVMRQILSGELLFGDGND
jgi:hypothetical protein